jgi:pyridoxal phosphate enzyme (YggS family)
MTIKQNILSIQQNIETAVKRRTAKEDRQDKVEIIAVTKTQPASTISEALSCGVKIIGENRVQEALDKYNFFRAEEAGIIWHLIGHLQTNKAKQAVEIFDLIHSIDSERLAVAVDNAAKKINKVQDILVQVNIGEEDSKFGLAPDFKEVQSLIKTISELGNLHLCGLMTIAPYYEDSEKTRPIFRELKRMFTELKSLNIHNIDLKWLSMGMTQDYIVAIEEGANMVRIGTGIFGER